MGQCQRVLDRLPLMWNPVQQNLEAHEVPLRRPARFDLYVHDRTVDLQMPGAVAVSFAHGRGVPHGDFQRPQDRRTSLVRRQTQTEVRTLQLGRRSLQQVDHGTVRNDGIRLCQRRWLDVSPPQKLR